MSKSLLAAALLSLFSAPLLAQEAPAEAPAEEAASPFAVTVWGVSDYKFRGVSQSQEDPAFQAALDYTHPSGFYAGIWASTIDFTANNTAPADEDHANVEIDTYVGYRFKGGDKWAFDLGLLRYNYPGTRDGFDYDYNELIVKATYADTYTATLGYSNDVFNTSENGTYFGLAGTWGLPADFKLNANVGYYDLDNALGDSYVDYGLGFGHKLGVFDCAVSYIGTSGNGRDLFGTLASKRVVLTVSLVL